MAPASRPSQEGRLVVASEPQSAISVLYEPRFQCCGEELHCVRVYHFTTLGQRHDVSLTHTKAQWVVYVDNVAMAHETHRPWNVFTSKNMSMHFNVDVPGKAPVRGILGMNWQKGGPEWKYDLHVSNVAVRAIWMRNGRSQKVAIPEVVGPPPEQPPPPLPPPAIEAPAQDILALLADISAAEVASSMQESTLSSLGPLPDAASGLPVALFPMQPTDRTFVLFEMSQNPKGAMLRCCEPVEQKPSSVMADSRAIIPYSNGNDRTVIPTNPIM